MTVTVDLSERQLKFGILKIALALVGLFALLAVGLSLLVDRGQSITMQLLFVSLTFFFVTNGALAVLHIIDWFEARKAKFRG